MSLARRAFGRLAIGSAAAAALGRNAAADQRDPRLDALFDQLRAAADPVEAHGVEEQIWAIWMQIDDAESARLLETGTVAMAGHRWAESQAALDALVARAPDFAEGWNKRATLAWAVRDLRTSVDDIRRTLALEPRHFGALSGLGLVFTEAGQVQGAISSFEAALAIYPLMPHARDHVTALRAQTKGEPL